MTAANVAAYIESLVIGPGDEEGFKFGDSEATVRGVLVCWMCTLQAIQRAASEDCNMIVCHENMHYPYAIFEPNLEKCLTWTVNR